MCCRSLRSAIPGISRCRCHRLPIGQPHVAAGFDSTLGKNFPARRSFTVCRYRLALLADTTTVSISLLLIMASGCQESSVKIYTDFLKFPGFWNEGSPHKAERPPFWGAFDRKCTSDERSDLKFRSTLVTGASPEMSIYPSISQSPQYPNLNRLQFFLTYRHPTWETEPSGIVAPQRLMRSISK